MILDKIVFQSFPPSHSSVAWARPIEGGFTLYIFNNGRWQPIKSIYDGDTPTTDDDVLSGPITEAQGAAILKQLSMINGDKDNSSSIDSNKEIVDFLEGYDNTETLKSVIDNATSTATADDIKALFT